MRGVSFYQLNGRVTRGATRLVNQNLAHALTSANFWSSSENNSNNSWNVNFASSGNSNNNNKYNSNAGRAVAALDDREKASVMEAYNDCCRDKMGSPDCVEFRLHAEEIIDLALSVKTRTYEPGLSDTFIVTRPKLREIFAAHFKDRIVQHWICLRLIPLFEERFYSMGNVSYNCRKGFGTLAARMRLYDDIHAHWSEEAQRLQKLDVVKYLRGLDANHAWESLKQLGTEKYVGKFDISSYFMSIDINVLWQYLKPFIEEKYQGDDKDTLLYLTEKTIFHRPQNRCVRKGNLDLWRYLPKSKSLFGKDDHTGMAIGNLTTQTLCNFYLSFFDEWLLARIASLGYDDPTAHYIRFVDDFVLHSMPVQHVTLLHKEAAQWLQQHLHLRLHPDKVYIQPQRHGVAYVGGILMPGRVYIVNRTVGAMRWQVRKMEYLCVRIMKEGVCENRLRLLNEIVSSVNSYSGFLVHGATYKIQKDTMYSTHYFWKVGYMWKNLSVVRVRKKYRLRNWLVEEERHRWRVMRAWEPRRRSGFPEGKRLPMIW